MKRELKKVITGITFQKEYICLALEEMEERFSIHLTEQHSTHSLDITSSHLFLGYKPLIFAVIFPAHESPFPGDICLSFNRDPFVINSQWESFPVNTGSVARIVLKRIVVEKKNNLPIAFYQGEYGVHQFVSSFHQLINTLMTRMRKEPPGNITLPGNLYDQVRIAYAMPRIISVLTVSDGRLINLFPTDLHGKAGDGYYICSLRIGGKACQQVQQFRNIVISEMDPLAYAITYQLGKNHMKDLTERSHFDLDPATSSHFGLPLPAKAVRYRELEWFEYFDVGIHRLFFCREIDSQELRPSNTLAHVHRYYAQWRSDHQIKTRYLSV